MAIGGSPPGAPRAKDGSKGAAGRFTFLVEVARGYLGALWLAHDGADSSETGTVYVRHVTPLVAASARAVILEGARWAVAGADSAEFQVLEARSAVDLVTPFMDGEVLRGLLRTAAVKHATIEPAVLLGIANELVEKMVSEHERALATKSPHGFGGVHPDSIFVDVQGQVHLLDIGAGAAASSREPWRSDPQRVGYFAPEQTEARGVVDARTDVFAVGVLLWEALANRRLFPGNDAKTARERVQKAPIARLDATRSSASPGVATEIADVVARCLERDPARRFQTMDELAGAIALLDTATPESIGAWVTTLADTSVGKRRQLLNRAAAGHGAPEERTTQPPPSQGARPGSLAPGRPSTFPPRSSPVPSSRPSSLAPRPTTSATTTPLAGGTPAAPVVAPRSGGTLPGSTPPVETPHPPRAHAAHTGAPPPPSARAHAVHAGAPPPPSARPSATSTPLAGMPLPPGAHAAAPAASTVATTPGPPDVRPGATSTPLAGTALIAQQGGAPHPRAPDATPPAPRVEAATPHLSALESVTGQSAPESADGSSEERARARADSAEAIEPEENDDSLEDDVEDDVESGELAVPDEPVTPSKRPPPLPHDEAHLPLAALAGQAGVRSDEPLARPIHQSELSVLTARSAPVGLPRSAVVAALVSLLALFGFVVIRWRAHVHDANTPQIERTVLTPPVRIVEPLSAVAPTASTMPPAVTAEPAHEPEPTPAPSAAPPVEPPATPEKTPATASTTRAESAEKPSSSKPTAHTGEPRHPASHEVTSTGFKPGGI